MNKTMAFACIGLLASAVLIGYAPESESQGATAPAYLVANFRITDSDAYSAYPPVAGPTLEPYGAVVLAVDGESNVLEGESEPQTVVIRFPSMDAALDWYNSPEYQEIIQLRTDNSEGFAVMINGIPGR